MCPGIISAHADETARWWQLLVMLNECLGRRLRRPLSCWWTHKHLFWIFSGIWKHAELGPVQPSMCLSGFRHLRMILFHPIQVPWKRMIMPSFVTPLYLSFETKSQKPVSRIFALSVLLGVARIWEVNGSRCTPGALQGGNRESVKYKSELLRLGSGWEMVTDAIFSMRTRRGLGFFLEGVTSGIDYWAGIFRWLRVFSQLQKEKTNLSLRINGPEQSCLAYLPLNLNGTTECIFCFNWIVLLLLVILGHPRRDLGLPRWHCPE